jgi:hypothetical protein
MSGEEFGSYLEAGACAPFSKEKGGQDDH